MRTKNDSLRKVSGHDILNHGKSSLSVEYFLSVLRNSKGKEKIRSVTISTIFDLDKQKRVQPGQQIQEKLKKEILRREEREIRETERFLQKMEQDLKKAN